MTRLKRQIKTQKASNCLINILVKNLKSSSFSIKMNAMNMIYIRTNMARPSLRKKKSNFEESKIPVIKNMLTSRNDENTFK